MVVHRSVFVMAFLLAFWPLNVLRSGGIDPAFQEQIEGLGSQEMVKAMVMMAERVDLEALNAELIANRAIRQERHERVVRALQEMAGRTQPALRRALEEAQIRGEVQRYRPYWVSNVIGVTATVDFIHRLAQRPDVGLIYEDRVIPLDKTFKASEGGEDPPAPHDVEPGVTSMRADSLWRAGITGEGVLVCNLDTGVNGNHPALADRWRGLDPGVTPQEAWFDPYNNSTFPVDDGNHGTGTMGCMAGASHTTGDTIGVAIGAKWIAANTFEDDITTSGAFTAAFEWTIDPDGNPATITDVPDVINNSWGSGPGCTDGDWASIDANIMAGIMVVFSAGNDGAQGPMSISSPASRITTSTNVFAVGATNANNQIAGFSSRGPSPCDGVTIKPEVVAHGSNIRTASQGGGYTIASGTSFSGPYAAGALALLRDIAPDATPDELMEILMNTAVDLGPAGEDNSYGHGIPDLVEAANAVLALERDPRITFSGSVVDDGNNGEPEAGESFDLVVYLGNMGISASDVEGTLSLLEPDPLVTIDSDFSTFGAIGPDTTGNNLGNPFHVTLDPETPGAHVLAFLLDVTADGGDYSEQLAFTLRTPFVITMADHDIGNVRFSVSDGGRFGWDSLDQTEGSGFVFPIDDVSQLYEGALVAGYDSIHVSHSARATPSGPVATDWQLVPGGEIQITTPGAVSDQDGHSRYGDGGADNPMGIEVTQRSYAWSDSTYHDFVIVEMSLHNTGIDSSSDIENFYVGMYMDWDVPNYASNNAAVDTASDVGYIWSPSSDKHCGVAVLTEPGLASFDLINNQDGSYEFTKAEYWQSLSGGIVDYSGFSEDWSYVISTGPFAIPAGDSITVALAVLGGEGLDDLLANVDAAQEIYGTPVGVGGDVAGGGSPLPRAFGLSQNYPNPFNPSTTIRYQIPERMGDGIGVSLEVFDLRGRKVRSLVNGSQAPGYYSIQWNGRDDRGERLASGVYLYRFKAGDFQETRRMLLVK